MCVCVCVSVGISQSTYSRNPRSATRKLKKEAGYWIFTIYSHTEIIIRLGLLISADEDVERRSP